MARPLVRLSSFACEFGDRERAPESIEGLAAMCAARGLTLGLPAMGCGTFWQMTGPLEPYILRCVSRTLASSGVPADAVGHLVFSTMDSTLRHVNPDLAREVLTGLGLVRCLPTLISAQQCASSLAAVEHASRLLAGPGASHAIVVSFDFVVDDADRVQSFALFGDAVTSCLVSRDAAGLAWRSYGVGVDFAGIAGRDSFETRKQVVATTLGRVLAEGGARLEDVERCFSTNFYKPIALFNAGISGIHRGRLGIDTLSRRAHCGNCDWMINLAHHQDTAGLAPGKTYLAQSFAPGFFACGLLGA